MLLCLSVYNDVATYTDKLEGLMEARDRCIKESRTAELYCLRFPVLGVNIN